jgi:exonuclease III
MHPLFLPFYLPFYLPLFSVTFHLFPSLVSFICVPPAFVKADTQCPTAPSSNPGDRRVSHSKLRLVQYNAEYLFIDPYKDCPGTGCPWANQTEAETHLQYVAKVVQTLQPDILNVCEVEGCDELHLLIEQLQDPTYLPYLIQGTDTGTGQNVGMLTRIDPMTNLYRTEERVYYPVPGSQCGYTNTLTTSGVSKHYITEFSIPTTQSNTLKVAMISAHLIAIPTDPARCSQREAQAQVLQNVIYYYTSSDWEIIMIGDFNDYDAEIMDLNSNQPISMVLDIIKGLKGDYAGTYQLSSIAQNISQSERYTDWWDSDNNCDTQSQNDYSMIDHILVTPQLVTKIAQAFVYHGYPEFCGTYNSDHYPLVVDFIL